MARDTFTLSQNVIHSGHTAEIVVTCGSLRDRSFEKSSISGVEILEKTFQEPDSIRFRVKAAVVSTPKLLHVEVPGCTPKSLFERSILLLSPIIKGMTFIPAGSYYLGSGNSGENRVSIERPFLIGTTEVSVADYADFLTYVSLFGAYTFHHPDTPADKDHLPGNYVDRNHFYPLRPVVGIDFFDAWAYAAWRGMRLPTHEEWEAAARGPLGSKFSWGDDYDTRRAVCQESADLPEKTESFMEHAGYFGLLHTVGNVWELATRPGNEGAGDAVLKGGSYMTPLLDCQLHKSRTARPGQRSMDIGMRLAADISQSTLDAAIHSAWRYALTKEGVGTAELKESYEAVRR